MARQVLSDKTVRKYARQTGLPIERMIARGGSGHWIRFRTTDHRHGYVKAGTCEVEWEEEPVSHWTSCAEAFPPAGDTVEVRRMREAGHPAGG